MKGSYIQPGDHINYTNTGDAKIAALALVLVGTLAGVAGCDIAPGETGSLALRGVFSFDKDTAAIDLGADVYYNSEDDVVTASADNGESGADKVEYTKIGVCTSAAAAADTAVQVRINC